MTDGRPRHAPRISLSTREWKLYVIGGLGLAYAASLAAIGTPADSAAWQPSATRLATANHSQAAQSSAHATSPPNRALRATAAAPRVMTRTS